MSSSSYWQSHNTTNRINDALSFIRTGSTRGNNLYVPNVRQGCQDSSRCASGWSCVGGYCQQNVPSGGEGDGDTSGCGGNGGSDGGSGGGGGCGASTASGASSGKCTKTGCGSNDGSDCCGERCCTFSGGSGNLVVSCLCGRCPPPPNSCNQFCDNYLKANGESAEGCSGECSECEECEQNTAIGEIATHRCQPKGDGPCWCPQSSCTGECEKCGDDGICRDDCRNCQRCVSIDIDCGCEMITTRCCQAACESESDLDSCRAKAQATCDQRCPPGPEGDPCEGECKTITVCDGNPPPCPPKSTCTSAGSIDAGGQTCDLIKVCDQSEVPDDCEECDCNCANDCPSCEICDEATGGCVPDPQCDEDDDPRWCIQNAQRWVGRTPVQPSLGNPLARCISIQQIKEGWRVFAHPDNYTPPIPCGFECTEVSSPSPQSSTCSGTGGGCSLIKTNGTSSAPMINNGLNNCAETTAIDLNGVPYRIATPEGPGCKIAWEWVFYP